VNLSLILVFNITIMPKFHLILSILFLSAVGVFLHSKQNSLVDETNSFVLYDTEGIKLSETMRVNGEVKYTHYFSRKGDTIFSHNWQIDVATIDTIREKIGDNFRWDGLGDFDVTGRSILFLLVDCERNIFEIRIGRGVSERLNQAKLRAISKVEKELGFICIVDYKTPIVISFPFPRESRHW